MAVLDQNYWQSRYSEGDTPWDIGHISPPMKAYIDKLEDRAIRILIPGAGKAFEAIYLHQQGFKEIYVLDWAMSAFDHLLAEVPDFPKDHLLCTDFFELHGQFDLILEQTFFCSLEPSLRKAYVTKMASLLPGGGTLAGLLFASHFAKGGPPFGGTEAEYITLFKDGFEICCIKIAKNSILPRMNNELFFELIKK
jgi:thiopurine S-methyltransferase